jgi:hypothetical protein
MKIDVQEEYFYSNNLLIVNHLVIKTLRVHTNDALQILKELTG